MTENNPYHMRESLGKSEVHSAYQAFEIIESAISEAVGANDLQETNNIFGRKVRYYPNENGLTFAAGMGASGLRSAAFVQINELPSVHQIQSMVRERIPAVIVLNASGKDFISRDGFGFIKKLSDITVVLYPENVQQAMDFIVLAHKIAETALLPVFCFFEEDTITEGLEYIKVPDAESLRRFSGNSDDKIVSPTPAQEIAFGKYRRRIPAWFNVDYPVLSGSDKSTLEYAFEVQANQAFYKSHLQEICEISAECFASEYNRKYNAITHYLTDDASHVIITFGGITPIVHRAVDYFRSQKVKAGCVSINIIHSGILHKLADLTQNPKAVTLLEPISGLSEKAPLYTQLHSLVNVSAKTLFSCRFMPGAFDIHQACTIFKHMLQTVPKPVCYYISPAGASPGEKEPKQEILSQTVQRNYPGLEQHVLHVIPETSIPDLPGVNAFFSCSHKDNAMLTGFLNPLQKVFDVHLEGKIFSRNDDSTTYSLQFSKGDKKTHQINEAPFFVLADLHSAQCGIPGLENIKQTGVLVIYGKQLLNIKLDSSVKQAIDEKNLTVYLLKADDLPYGCYKLTGAAIALLKRALQIKTDNKKLINTATKWIDDHSPCSTNETASDLEYGMSVLQNPVTSGMQEMIPAGNKALPSLLRSCSGKGPEYTRLSGFHDIAAGYYKKAIPEQQTLNPFQALTTLPPLSSGLIPAKNKTGNIPLLQTSKCTACGLCFVYCPHFALPPLVIGLEQLLQGAMSIAAREGNTISLFTPVVKQLASLAGKTIKEAEQPITKIADFLPQSFDQYISQAKVKGEKRDGLRSEFNILMHVIGEMPVVISDTFFYQPEKDRKGAGGVFMLSLNTASCTGCGICAVVCAEDAIEMRETEEQMLSALEKNFNLWENLPDTSGETILQAFDNDSYNGLAAVLLSKHFYTALFGGDLRDEDAPSKVALHALAACAESALQPRMKAMTEKTSGLLNSLTEHIQSLLGEALPMDYIDELDHTITSSGSEKMTLEELLSNLREKNYLKQIKTDDLHRKLQLVRDLKALKWMLTEGPSGNGRSRFSIALLSTDAFKWVGRHPFNHFASPVILPPLSGSKGWITGLAEGHIRHMLDNIRLLRRAELEIKDKYKPVQHNMEIAGLTWEDLTTEEKSMIQPLIVIGHYGSRNKALITEAVSLLREGKPVKLFLGCPPGTDTADPVHTQAFSALLDALTLEKVDVLQTTLAAPKHLVSGLIETLKSENASLIHMFMADYDPEGQWINSSSTALHARMYPLVKYPAAGSGKSMASRIDLSANPSSEEEFSITQLQYNDEIKTYKYTAADLALLYDRHRNAFKEWDESSGHALPLAEYIELDARDREGKTPVVILPVENGEFRTYEVPEKYIALTQSVLYVWRTLRDIAGMQTDFPEKVRSTIEAELKAAHQKEIDRLKSSFQAELQQLEEKHLQNIKERIKRKLLELSSKTME